MKHLLYIEMECFNGLGEKYGTKIIPMVGQWVTKTAIIKGTIKELNKEITFLISNIDLFSYCHFHFARWEDLKKMTNFNKQGGKHVKK